MKSFAVLFLKFHIIIALSSCCVAAGEEEPARQENYYKSDCYDPVSGAPRKCMPEFINAGKWWWVGGACIQLALAFEI